MRPALYLTRGISTWGSRKLIYLRERFTKSSQWLFAGKVVRSKLFVWCTTHHFVCFPVTPFTGRQHSSNVVHAVQMPGLSYRKDVSLSVRLSHPDTVSKRRKLESRDRHSQVPEVVFLQDP